MSSGNLLKIIERQSQDTNWAAWLRAHVLNLYQFASHLTWGCSHPLIIYLPCWPLHSPSGPLQFVLHRATEWSRSAHLIMSVPCLETSMAPISLRIKAKVLTLCPSHLGPLSCLLSAVSHSGLVQALRCSVPCPALGSLHTLFLCLDSSTPSFPYPYPRPRRLLFILQNVNVSSWRNLTYYCLRTSSPRWYPFTACHDFLRKTALIMVYDDLFVGLFD